MKIKKRLGKPTHVSWFIAAASFGVVAGTALCLVIASNAWAAVEWLIVVFCLFLISAIKRPKAFLALALVGGLLLGLHRGSLVEQQYAVYEPFLGHTVNLHAKVVEDASYGERGDLRLRLGNVYVDDQSLAGEVWVSLDSSADIKRGDIVKLRGQLKDGFGNLQATMFQAELHEVVRPRPGDMGRVFRDWFAGGIARAIPEPEANLGVGYLVGQKTALPEELEEQIRITGLTHVVVASGYNLMILVKFARKKLSKYSKYLATLAGGLMIIGFMMVSGLSPSMSRAGLVAGLGLLAWYYGRKAHPVVLLSFAAAITLLVRPSYVWGDIGWFLSFAAFTGVIILAPLLHAYFWGKDKKPGFVRELVVATMSAQLMTLPIIVFIFGQYSIYALPANLLVLPVVPFAMLFTFIAGLGALIIPPLAIVFGLPATILLGYSIFVVQKIAGLPHASGEATLTLGSLVLSFMAMMILMLVLWKATKHNFRTEKNSIELI